MTMIDSISTASGSSAGTASGSKVSVGEFSDFSTVLTAAEKAAQQAEQRKKEHAAEVDAIKSGGFTAWVRDTQIETLKEKLRKQVMADMGIDENSLSHLSSVMRNILEQKIQEEIERRMQEESAKNDNGKAKGIDQASTKDQPPPDQAKIAAAQQTGKNDQDGKTCPVIPALVWP
ncbi:MAG TPA: hypothetical protein VK196_13985, partial [Magnetospirillum sp.]|nr:hypothetical protein [Magnetospirillum sp.]